jgi:hypothetical protein
VASSPHPCGGADFQLLLLISFTTNYGDDNVFHLSSLPADDKGLF